MDNSKWPEVRAEAERQGWIVEETTDGYQLKSPDGKTIVFLDRFHKSSSQYALAATVRRMRQAGFLWPPPKVGGR